MRARWTLTFAVAAAAVLVALPAGAQTEIEVDDPADRALVHGYDPTALQLFWMEMMGDAATVEEDCAITPGEYSYEVDDEGNVITLTPQEDGDPVDLEACEFQTTDVEGPQGQVNHGSVVSNFVHDLKEYLDEAGYSGGVGCYVRIIAQSDYGKGDDQIRVPDVTDEENDATEGNVELSVDETRCNGWNGDSDEELSTSGGPQGNGKPDHAGPPENRGNGNGGPPAHAGGNNGKGKGGR